MISASNIVKSLRSDIHLIYPGVRVLLFGSRSRGDFEKGNDFDILVITPDEISPKNKFDLESNITKALVKKYHYPFDVLVYGKNEVERKKDQKSLVLYHALKESIEI
jgi:predicted nucleotidyltransferase